jgi:hypothetical protein
MSRRAERFELILAHRYGTGAALDFSGYENNGRVEGNPRRVAGPRPETAALGFDGVDDRIVVPPSVSLRRLPGLRVDASVRLDELGGRRTIVEGSSSFSLLVEPDGIVEGTVYNGSRWEGVRSARDAIPLGRWVRITFVYDGLDTSALYLDDTLLGLDHRPLGSIEPVDWPFGLNVGGWPDRDVRMFRGAIDEVKLWRRAA